MTVFSSPLLCRSINDSALAATQLLDFLQTHKVGDLTLAHVSAAFDNVWRIDDGLLGSAESVAIPTVHILSKSLDVLDWLRCLPSSDTEFGARLEQVLAKTEIECPAGHNYIGHNYIGHNYI